MHIHMHGPQVCTHSMLTHTPTHSGTDYIHSVKGEDGGLFLEYPLSLMLLGSRNWASRWVLVGRLGRGANTLSQHAQKQLHFKCGYHIQVPDQASCQNQKLSQRPMMPHRGGTRVP